MALLKNTALGAMLPEKVDNVSPDNSGNVDLSAVRYSENQGLTNTQKGNARTNIGAFSSSGGTISGNVEINDGSTDPTLTIQNNDSISMEKLELGARQIKVSGETGPYTIEFPFKNGKFALLGDLPTLAGETMPNVPTNRELIAVVKKIFKALGGTVTGETASAVAALITSAAIFSSAVLSPFSAKAEITPDTEWWDVPQTNTLHQVAVGAGLVSTGDLAKVATSGSYNDLSNRPTIPAAQVNSDWNASSGVAQILNKPNLATVATSGSYNDLSNKPTIPAAQVNADWNASSGVAQILNKPNLATVATTGSYNDLSNKPSIPAAQVQADWNEASVSSKAYIQNKPTKLSQFANDQSFATSNCVDNATTLNIRELGDWTCSPSSEAGSDFLVMGEDWGDLGWQWLLIWNGDIVGVSAGSESDNSVSITIGSYMELPEELQPYYWTVVLATRTNRPGYILGVQSNKVLAAQSSLDVISTNVYTKSEAATKAEVTLNEREFGEWVVSPDIVVAPMWCNGESWQETYPDDPYGTWMVDEGSGPAFLGGDYYTTESLSWEYVMYNPETGEPEYTSVTASRSHLPGYILGSQSDKILAAQGDLSVLTTNVYTKSETDSRIVELAPAQVQANWNETSTSSKAYINNKPTKLSQFTNDSGFITGYTETDPTVGLTNSTIYVHGWHTNIVASQDNGAVTIGERHGDYTNIYTVGYLFYSATYTNIYWHGTNSFVVGEDSDAYGKYSMAQGRKCLVYGDYSYAAGNRAVAGALGYNFISGQPTGGIVNRDYTYVWQGVSNVESNYYSHGNGTYNVNPTGGIGGFYIGETNLAQHIANLAPAPDLSGYATTNDVANLAAETNVTFSVSNDVFAVSTNGTVVWSSASSGGNRNIAMFIIPVNPRISGTVASTNSNTNPWVGFELKASTNNFASGSPDSKKLQFYGQSECGWYGLGNTVDKMKMFICTSKMSGDLRSYQKLEWTANYSHQINEVVVLVDMSCLTRNPGGEWLREDNEDLIWVYSRDRNGYVEFEAGTDKQMWRPISPVRWYKNLPKWAQQ